jgi:hypothetical protein
MAELLKDIAARKGTDPALIDERGGTPSLRLVA